MEFSFRWPATGSQANFWAVTGHSLRATIAASKCYWFGYWDIAHYILYRDSMYNMD